MQPKALNSPKVAFLWLEISLYCSKEQNMEGEVFDLFKKFPLFDQTPQSLLVRSVKKQHQTECFHHEQIFVWLSFVQEDHEICFTERKH